MIKPTLSSMLLILFVPVLTLFQCSKRDWDDDGYDEKDDNKAQYNNNNNNYKNSYNKLPTNRPTYRPYSYGQYNSGQYNSGQYNSGQYNSGQYYNTYSSPTGWQGATMYDTPRVYNAHQAYNPYAPSTSYTNSYSVYNTGYKSYEPDPWEGDSYKKIKTKKPTASPTLSSPPSVSLEPSLSPSVSSAPSTSSRPSVSFSLVHTFADYVIFLLSSIFAFIQSRIYRKRANNLHIIENILTRTNKI